MRQWCYLLFIKESRELLAKLELDDFDLILRKRRLCLFRHVMRSSGASRTACDYKDYTCFFMH